MRDTWTERELPILVAISEVEAEGSEPPDAKALADRTGFDQDEVLKSVRSLHEAEPPYVEAHVIELAHSWLPADIQGIRLLERGLRAVGQWPSGDPYDEFVRAAQASIESETDPERRSRMERLLGAATDVGKGVATSILGEFLKRSAGL